MQVELADLEDPEVCALIAYHQKAMLDGSPPGMSFALDLSGLRQPAVTVWRRGSMAGLPRSARSNGSAMGARK